MEVILNINDLEYQNIFRKISLSIEKSKITTIAGSNNCGKTTISRILDRKIVDNFNINLMGKDIKDYSLEEYNHLIQVVYPLKVSLKENSPIEELNKKEIEEEKKFFLEKKIKSLKLEKDMKRLTNKEKILTQVILAIGKSEELVIIDGIDNYFGKKELEPIYKLIRECTNKFKMTFIMTSTSLDCSLLTDYLYILKEGEIILQGDPLTILQKDNVINKAGLNVPFMIDLSVKLRDYDLIKNIELDKEKMVDVLWN